MIEIGINPVVFTIGLSAVRWYGIMVALAVLTIILWMIREHRKGANLSPDSMLTAALVAIPSGVIISRLLHVFASGSGGSHNRISHHHPYPGLPNTMGKGRG